MHVRVHVYVYTHLCVYNGIPYMYTLCDVDLKYFSSGLWLKQQIAIRTGLNEHSGDTGSL